jgi:exonuclease III
VLSTIVDLISPVYAQGGIDLLLKAGYVDCFRRVNPRSPGFTCVAALPAGRIDFIFASPEVAQRLSNSQVVTEGEGVNGAEASDHFAVYAEFEGVAEG